MSEIERVAKVTIAVRDQQEALQWFEEKLGFERRTDTAAPEMRWLTMAPRNQKGFEFILASWFPQFVGKNAPCVVETRSCASTWRALRARGVTFSQEPTQKAYGIEAVFEDLYGNTYALIENC